MQRLIRMDFKVESRIQKESAGYRIVRFSLALIPAIYFIWCAYSYWAAQDAIYNANENITASQDKAAKYERDMKNSMVVLRSGTAEVFMISGSPRATYEVYLTDELKDAVARVKSEMRPALKKLKMDEEKIFEGIYRLIGNYGGRVAVTRFELNLRTLKASFEVECSKKEEFKGLCEKLKNTGWAVGVFVTKQACDGLKMTASVTIDLLEAALYE
ncbi:MAG TPA: hypothetical protein PKK26_19580 [Candidatus Wallbacteria bacterium]|mgnify:CR=1 FL=1|nr:hypothetical protein [Candidatus Wallbacteria bacterium]